MKLRSIKSSVSDLHRKMQDYTPGGAWEAQWTRPEEFVAADSEKYLKFIPVPDKKTEGLFLEIKTHKLGSRFYACPGQVCRNNPALPCYKANDYYGQLKPLYKKKDAGTLTPDEAKEFDRISEKYRDLKGTMSHFYYVIDVTPIIRKSKQIAEIPDCWGDDKKRESNHADCGACPMAIQCQDRLKVLRYNCGRQGKSNGEKLYAAYSDSEDLIASVFEISGKGGKIKTRPIKITRKDAGLNFPDYKFTATMSEISIPASVIDKIAEEMEPMSVVVEETLKVKLNDLIKITHDTEYDFGKEGEEEDDEDEKPQRVKIKRLASTTDQSDEEDDDEEEEDDIEEEEDEEEEEDLEALINDPDVITRVDDVPVCRGHYHKSWSKCDPDECEIYQVCRKETLAARKKTTKKKVSSVKKKTLTPEERAKKEGLRLPKCFGNSAIFERGADPCDTCEDDHAWVVDACEKRCEEVPY